MHLLFQWLVEHFRVLYYLHHLELWLNVLCLEQKRLQKSRKKKKNIKQLMKCAVQIMGTGSSSVLMIINSALFFFSYRECTYKRWAVCRLLQVSIIFPLITRKKKKKEKLHINNLQFEQPYSSILTQNPWLFAVG